MSGRFDATPDELKRIEECLKDEEFCKLFAEYAQDLHNPETRKEYEAYLRQLEAEGEGGDVHAPSGGTIVIPDPVFCFKIRRTTDNIKVFVNVCKSDKVDKPEEIKMPDQQGSQWRMPLSLGSMREDRDRQGDLCRVYDIVFHPEALEKATVSRAFRNMLIDISRSHLVDKFQEPLSEQFSVPRLKSKGDPAPQTVRSGAPAAPGGAQQREQMRPPAHIAQMMQQQQQPSRPAKRATAQEDPPLQFEDPWESSSGLNSALRMPTAAQQEQERGGLIQEVGDEPQGPKTPKFEIVERGAFDMSEYTHAKVMTRSLPKELVVRICLPGLDSAEHLDLDVGSNSFSLQCEGGEYALEAKLPHTVNEEEGTASFESETGTLVITLPVVAPPRPAPRPFVEPEEVEEDKEVDEKEAQGGSYGRHSSNVSFSEDITVVESPSGDGDSDPRSPLQRVNTPHPRKSANFVEESVVQQMQEEEEEEEEEKAQGRSYGRHSSNVSFSEDITVVQSPCGDGDSDPRSPLQRVNTPHPRKSATFMEESIEQHVEVVVEEEEEDEDEAKGGSYGRHSSNVSFSEDITVVESPSGDGDSDPRSPLQRVNTPHPRKSANFVEEAVSQQAEELVEKEEEAKGGSNGRHSSNVSFSEDITVVESPSADGDSDPRSPLQRVNTPHPRKSATFVSESVSQQVEEEVEEVEETKGGSYGRHSSNVSFSEDITVVQSPSGDGESDPRSPLQRVNTPHPSKNRPFITEEKDSPDRNGASPQSAAAAGSKSRVTFGEEPVGEDAVALQERNKPPRSALAQGSATIRAKPSAPPANAAPSSSSSSSSTSSGRKTSGVKLQNTLMFELD